MCGIAGFIDPEGFNAVYAEQIGNIICGIY